MPVRPSYEVIDVPDAGVTTTLDHTSGTDRYIFNQTQTGVLTGNVSITGDDIPASDGSEYIVEYPGGMTLGGFSITIFGQVFTSSQAANECRVWSRWNGSAYKTQIYTNWSDTNTVLQSHMSDDSVGTDEIVDDAVTIAKMAALDRGNIIRGDASGNPEAYDIAGVGAGAVFGTDGTDALAQLITQDITLNSAFAATIANDAVTTAKILDAAVTWAKLQSLARGSVLRGSAAGIVEALSLSGAGTGAMVMTDATDVLALQMSGDATMDGTGAVTISAGLNTYITKVTIPTASVLTANTTPITIVGAPGAGKYIRVVAAMETLTFNSIAYATNGITQLRHDTASDPSFAASNTFLFGTVTHTGVMQEQDLNAVTDTQIIANKEVLWETLTGDPTAGDSDVVVYALYQIVDV